MLAAADVELAQETTATFPNLVGMSNLGNKGKISGNVHRDFMALCNKQQCCMPEPVVINMPFKIPKGVFKQGILLPHEVFSALYNFYPEAFRKIICPSDDELQQFWDCQEGNAMLDDNPLTSVPNFKRLAIPLGLHGDEVPVVGKGKVWSKSSLTFQWISLMGVGPGKESCM